MRSRLLAGLLLVSACSSGGDDTATPSTSSSSTSSSTTTTTSTTVVPSVEVRTSTECPGLGAAPAEEAPEVTWVADGRLVAEGRCLLELDDDPVVVEWGGLGDRVLLGRDLVVLPDGPRRIDGVDAVIGWSRPTGRAVLAQDDGLVKVTLDQSTRVEFPTGTEVLDAAYHPAGTAVVSLVDTPGHPQVLLTDNLGGTPTWLSANEEAHELRDLAFDGSGNLLFVADHGGVQHLHRVTIGEDVAVTLTEGPDLGPVVASPYSTLVAVGRGTCDDPRAPWIEYWMHPPLGEPVGWLPDGRLVLLRREACGEPGELVVAHPSDGERTIATGVTAAAVRAVLPPPPPEPGTIVGSGFA